MLNAKDSSILVTIHIQKVKTSSRIKSIIEGNRQQRLRERPRKQYIIDGLRRNLKTQEVIIVTDELRNYKILIWKDYRADQ